MIKDKIIVKRYADAYFDFVRHTIGEAPSALEFKNLKSIIRDNPEFLEFLEAPDVTHQQKFEFINNVLKDYFSVEFRNFIKLLLDKDRIKELVDILEYVRETYSHGEEIEAVIRTSLPLDLDIIKEIEEMLVKKFKRNFKFYISLDGSLLGGVQVQVGNTVIDGSVRRRIDELREKLSTVRVN
ncbi:MAG: ATP synthase F1 subunit delta [Candidatus Omnitrophica bacterium]|nr:ATP synthase F1 subunit delta [Candidatus Omnitrophota bacterium]